jgi:hypothetical protein
MADEETGIWGEESEQAIAEENSICWTPAPRSNPF